ncbi:hypothetical protein ACJZTR_00370 [Neorickettsia risticii]
MLVKNISNKTVVKAAVCLFLYVIFWAIVASVYAAMRGGFLPGGRPMVPALVVALVPGALLWGTFLLFSVAQTADAVVRRERQLGVNVRTVGTRDSNMVWKVTCFSGLASACCIIVWSAIASELELRCAQDNPSILGLSIAEGICAFLFVLSISSIFACRFFCRVYSELESLYEDKDKRKRVSEHQDHEVGSKNDEVSIVEAVLNAVFL